MACSVRMESLSSTNVLNVWPHNQKLKLLENGPGNVKEKIRGLCLGLRGLPPEADRVIRTAAWDTRRVRGKETMVVQQEAFAASSEARRLIEEHCIPLRIGVARG